MTPAATATLERPAESRPAPRRDRCRADHVPYAGSLYYVCDPGVGITRQRTKDGFVYRYPSGRKIRDRHTLERVRRLAIPPAWEDVWICTDPDGHLQATGRDAKGRKQYKYHQAWRELRDAGKFERMASFGRALPKIRRTAEADLARPDLSRDKVLGLVVLLLDETLLRVGNEEYARQNEAYGLTTLRDRHAFVCGAEIRLVFRGKGGKPQIAGLTNRRLARIVKRTQELPGDMLFQYLDDGAGPVPISSGDVNEYLRAIAGTEFSAKDFRTWGGTLAAARQLAAGGQPRTGKRDVVSRVNAALDVAAAHLGNTRAIARRSYVHPGVIALFLEGGFTDNWAEAMAASARHPVEQGGLTAEEQALLAVLDRVAPG